MGEIVGDCPRCGASRATFDILADVQTGIAYSWADIHEAMCVCRHCARSSIFVLELSSANMSSHFLGSMKLALFKGSLTGTFNMERYISLRDKSSVEPPEHVPPLIAGVFGEGASSLAGSCYNAAGAMFRLCLDLVTKDLLPSENGEAGPNNFQRRNLAPRLEWLFEQQLLPADLKDLATCVKDHGNDGAHDGTLTKIDAEDLLDFTTALLERQFTQPARVAAAQQRRADRHST